MGPRAAGRVAKPDQLSQPSPSARRLLLSGSNPELRNFVRLVMKRVVWVVLATGLLTGCGQQAGPSVQPTPPGSRAISSSSASATPSPHSGPHGVLVSFPQGTGPSNAGYDIAVVDISGRVVAHAHAAVRTFIEPSGISAPAAVDLPEVSMSSTRLYFLDGDAQVRSLSVGSTAAVARIPGSASSHAAFAVSPDDRRMAVGVIDYSPATRMPVDVRLYVQDLDGANQNQIYSSTTNFVWPVGWHNGELVLAAGAPLTQQGIVGNPYSALSYHIVDAANASRIATIGSGDFQHGCATWGPLTSAGTACYTRTASAGMGGYFTLLGWDGHNVLPGNGQFPTASGGWAAIGTGSRSVDLAMCCDDSSNVSVRMPLGGVLKTAMNGQQADWVCWLDANHLLSGSVYQQQFQPQLLILDTNAVAAVDGKGFCAGIIPGDLTS